MGHGDVIVTAPNLKVPCIQPAGTVVGIGLALLLPACVPAGLHADVPAHMIRCGPIMRLAS